MNRLSLKLLAALPAARTHLQNGFSRLLPLGLTTVAATAITLGSSACTSQSQQGNETNLKETSTSGATSGDGKPFVSLLEKNDAGSRAQIASDMEQQLASLLTSTQASHKTLREMVLATTRALREGGQTICPDAAKITVFRGHGFGLIPGSKDGKKFILSQYMTSDLGRFKGLDWEAQAQKLYPNQKINLLTGLQQYSKAGVSCGNGADAGATAIDPFDYAKLAERHSLYCPNSLLISTSIDPEIARGFKAPVIEAKVCPGRILPTSFQPFGNELEYLVFGFILPEEVVKIHGFEQSELYRKGITDPEAKAQAEARDYEVALPELKETTLQICSAHKIGFQNSAEVGQYTEAKLNQFTATITGLLEKQRAGSKINWSTLKSDFVSSCSCDTFVKDKGYNRDDWCS